MRRPTLSELPPPLPDKTGWPWTEETSPLPETMPDGSPWPRISVVTPSYNQGQFIEETIRSVLLQGYPNLEYIVIDGGSTDGSVEIIKKYEPWLKYWVSEKDRGQSHAINKGWQQAHGDLVSYLNSDDIYLPGALWRVAEQYKRNTQSAFYIGETVVGDEHLYRLNVLKPRIPVSVQDVTLADMRSWAFPQQSCFWQRHFVQQSGWLREELHYVMDRELFYRMCKLAPGVSISAELAISRMQPDAKSVKDMLKMYQEDAKALAFHRTGDWFHDAKRWRLAWQFLSYGYLRQAKKAVKDSVWRATVSLLFSIVLDPTRLVRRSFYGEVYVIFFA